MIGSRGLLSEYSGIETLLREICPRLALIGHEVTVFGDRSNVSEYKGVKIEATPSLRTKHLETLSRSMIATIKACRNRFDILHYHDVGPALFGTIGRPFGIPSILTLHSLDWRRSKWSTLSRGAIRRIEQVSVTRMDAVTVVSECLGKYLSEQYDIGSTFLPNVVEKVSFVRPSSFSARLTIEPRKYLLFVGRLSPEKGLHDLIDAYRQLDTELALVVAGGPGYDVAYSNLLQHSANGLNVIFAGHVSAPQLSEFIQQRICICPAISN